jgi:thioredoxin-disulfide reductase
MIYDLIIIGGGPAGIAAGIYGARKKLNTLLISKEWGGQIVDASEIENWPGTQKISGLDLMNKMVEHLKSFTLEIKQDREVINLEKKNSNFAVRDNKDEEHETKTVIIATGKIPRALNIPGEKEFKGKGVSICSTCDAPMFKDKDVAIIGGGNVGFNMALDLSKYSNKVYILEFLEQTQGDEILKEKLEKTGKVEIYTNAAVKEIKGSKFVESLIYENRDTGKDIELKVQGVFIAIGMMPKAGFAEGLVDFNKAGEIQVDKHNITKTPGLFAAGDITDVKYEQIIIAGGEGAKAALGAYDYLKNK